MPAASARPHLTLLAPGRALTLLILGMIVAPGTPAIDCPPCLAPDVCTVGTCDTTTGFCRFEPRDCEDGNPCTHNYCEVEPEPAFGGCRTVTVPAGTACDDGDPCTAGDICAGTECVASPQPAGALCDDGNPCTVGEACDETGACIGSALSPGTICDDGSPCTTGDVCVEGEAGQVTCEGADVDCSGGDPCSPEACDPATGDCVAAPLCDDGNPCTEDGCDPLTGACLHSPVASSCSDGDLCTNSDVCVDGNCLSGEPFDCDDHQACTYDICRNEYPVCLHEPDNSVCPPSTECMTSYCDEFQGCVTSNRVGGSCDPGNACYTGICVRGDCEIDATLSCDDSNSCTADSCDPVTGCRNDPVADGTPCDDPCTGAGTCVGGMCDGGAPVDCDDGNACTVDSCRPGDAFCLHAARDCSDGDACTQDLCDPVLGCDNTVPTVCDDNSVCTVDSCDPATGCLATPADCDDGDPCTIDSCDPAGGCFSTARICDDRNACTVDRCDPAAGGCVADPVDCDDDDPCTVDYCDRNQGCKTIPVACSDGDPCTAEVCDPVQGCIDAGPLDCDDGDACTVDSCDASGCANVPRSCDDGNVCTADGCDPATGCTSAPITGLPVTCGIGACERTVDSCVDGVPQACVPGDPTPEKLNGIDDDCDGEVDEGTISADCSMTPTTIDVTSQGKSFSFLCRFFNVSDPDTPLPAPAVSRVYVSRAGSVSDPVLLPDPFAAECPDPALGFLFEPGIVEDRANRDSAGDALRFRFDLPVDGDCRTLDGDRQDLIGVLGDLPHQTEGVVCIAGMLDASPFEGCVTVEVRNPRSR